MILVTLGTQEFPFDRLLRALEPVDEELVIQCRRASFRPARAEWHDLLPYEALVDLVRRARVVVCHAGVGSVLTAVEQGRRPVVVPRLRRYGEAVDDHQVLFARRLAAAGHVKLVEDLDDLPAALTAESQREPDLVAQSHKVGLAADLRAYLQDLTQER